MLVDISTVHVNHVCVLIWDITSFVANRLWLTYDKHNKFPVQQLLLLKIMCTHLDNWR